MKNFLSAPRALGQANLIHLGVNREGACAVTRVTRLQRFQIIIQQRTHLILFQLSEVIAKHNHKFKQRLSRFLLLNVIVLRGLDLLSRVVPQQYVTRVQHSVILFSRIIHFHNPLLKHKKPFPRGNSFVLNKYFIGYTPMPERH